jgi:acyl-CoA synthetase (NDP forming)
MRIDLEKIRQILQTAKLRGATALLETEGVAVLDALGIAVPKHLFARSADEAALIDLSVLPGDKVVIKVISPKILHKSDVGGVAVVPRREDTVVRTIALMERKFKREEVVGFTVNEFISYNNALGNELLVGARWTEDFGPVVTFGPGGIYTEFLSKNFKTGKDVAIVSAELKDGNEFLQALESPAVTQLVTGSLRGQAPRIDLKQISEVVGRFIELSNVFMPEDIFECEINPLVIADGSLVALDILVKLGKDEKRRKAERPIRKLRNLLQPRSAAIIGVSEKLNPGHIILNNLIREGFERERIFVIKPGIESIEGCRCYSDIASMPQRVDLFILSLDAAQAPGVVTEIVEGQKAESIILIPGGLEEKQGTEAIVARMHEALDRARTSEWQGPVINGGNCLGITSRPGRYDTMFIPEHKLPVPKIPVSPVAILSQSGAFAVAKASKLAMINPKYSISLGNQMDLMLGDYLIYLKDDPDIEIFAVYVEGFRRLDGLRFLKAAEEITASGRTVIFYRAGRTAAGAQAAASHTASIAGDYAVTQHLCASAGVVVAESVADFEDLTRLFTFLRGKEVPGWRLGAVSNAGFECVSISDNLGRFELAEFTPPTVKRLHNIFQASRIDQVVDIHNPIDLTPMTGDAAFAETVQAVLEDGNVDVGVVGCVPLTAALNTLAPGVGHHDDLFRDDSIAMRLAALGEKLSKPWVVVIDSGSLYDPMAQALEAHGLLTCRTADRALGLLNVFCKHRIANEMRKGHFASPVR